MKGVKKELGSIKLISVGKIQTKNRKNHGRRNKKLKERGSRMMMKKKKKNLFPGRERQS